MWAAASSSQNTEAGPTGRWWRISCLPGAHNLRLTSLRRFLREKLPEYMVPSVFIKVDSLPLTPNGKVDYAALPEPGQDTEASVAEPRTSIERSLVQIWEELLGVAHIGISDNFFDLGGHSLLAIQLIARLEKRFGRTLAVSALFQAPTIEQLASILTDERRQQSWSSLIPLQPEGSEAHFFWIHGDWSNALLSRVPGAESTTLRPGPSSPGRQSGAPHYGRHDRETLPRRVAGGTSAWAVFARWLLIWRRRSLSDGTSVEKRGRGCIAAVHARSAGKNRGPSATSTRSIAQMLPRTDRSRAAREGRICASKSGDRCAGPRQAKDHSNQQTRRETSVDTLSQERSSSATVPS